MPTNTSLENKIKLFNTRYNVNFDPHAIAEEARIDDVFDGFRFDQQDPKVKQASNYLKNLFETLTDSLNARTQINARADYDLSDINIVSFVRDYEEIMAQRNAESKEPKERKPYEGMNFEKLIEKATGKTKEYDKTIYSIWANKVVDGKISFKTLKKITDESIRNIERQEKENRPVSREDLANVVLAYEAMFRVSQSRGFFWKLFNFFREDRYLDSLSNKRMEYVNKNYPVQDILDKTPDSVMQETYTNTKYALNRIDNEKYEVKRQAEEKKAEEQRREISDVAEKLEPTINDYNFNNKIKTEIVNALPKGKWSKNIQKTILSDNFVKSLITDAQNANKQFDSNVAYGQNPENAIVNNVRAVFNNAYKLTEALGYYDPKDQLLAAQAITDVMMKNVSPATLEPEKYVQFANGYALSNPSSVESVTNMDGTENAFVEAKNAYDEMNRVALNIEEANLNVKADVVKPVENVEKINPPIKNV